MSKLRRKIETRYVIAEVLPAEIDAGMLETLKKIGKKGLGVMIGLGIMSTSANAMHFTKPSLDSYIKTVNQISEEEGGGFKAEGKLKETNGVQVVEIKYTGADGSGKIIHYVKDARGGEHVEVREKRVDGGVDSNVEWISKVFYDAMKKDIFDNMGKN